MKFFIIFAVIFSASNAFGQSCQWYIDEMERLADNQQIIEAQTLYIETLEQRDDCFMPFMEYQQQKNKSSYEEQDQMQYEDREDLNNQTTMPLQTTQFGFLGCLSKEGDYCFEFPKLENGQLNCGLMSSMTGQADKELKDGCPSAGRIGECEQQMGAIMFKFIKYNSSTQLSDIYYNAYCGSSNGQ